MDGHSTALSLPGAGVSALFALCLSLQQFFESLRWSASRRPRFQSGGFQKDLSSPTAGRVVAALCRSFLIVWGVYW
jgi:hypothetical protein